MVDGVSRNLVKTWQQGRHFGSYRASWAAARRTLATVTSTASTTTITTAATTTAAAVSLIATAPGVDPDAVASQPNSRR